MPGQSWRLLVRQMIVFWRGSISDHSWGRTALPTAMISRDLEDWAITDVSQTRGTRRNLKVRIAVAETTRPSLSNSPRTRTQPRVDIAGRARPQDREAPGFENQRRCPRRCAADAQVRTVRDSFAAMTLTPAAARITAGSDFGAEVKSHDHEPPPPFTLERDCKRPAVGSRPDAGKHRNGWVYGKHSTQHCRQGHRLSYHFGSYHVPGPLQAHPCGAARQVFPPSTPSWHE